ncbi:MAG: asparagine synthase (glutamine-hydrolyzing) [Deltaproteobacteria bacterium]|nr:asparagine synthase (glutamine-hydrolyzing) [Deltaproteobacteria bacterium]
MCGIAGIYNFNGSRVRPDHLNKMADLMAHRGPDDEGFFIEANMGLAMRRLSIIDLKTGNQPMANEAKTVWVVMNGEIYNFIELRDMLEKRGHVFGTASDTETLVHLYEEYGLDMASHLNGMYAIALWDAVQRKLILIRDRLGIKQLYYHADGMRFSFASEIKPILSLPWVERSPEWSSITDYLTLLYIPGPLTAFKGIKSLMPGAMLIITEKDISGHTYWRLDDWPVSLKGSDEKEAAGELGCLIEDSIRLELRSDAPLGVFLSAGLDSTTIAVFSARATDKRLKTFSAGYEDTEDDELDGAGALASMLGTDHRELLIKYDDVLSELPRIVYHLEQPIGDSAMIPSYMLSRLASKEVKVVLNGAGGDELFAGYARHRKAPLLKRAMAHLPCPLFVFLASEARGLRKKNLFGKAADYCLSKNLFFTESMVFSSNVIDRLSGVLPERKGEIALLFKEASHSPSSGGGFRGTMAADLKIYLPDDILFLLDRTTMAASVEARVPLLDHRIVEFMHKVPDGMKVKGKERKALLRLMMRGRLPEGILKGRRKSGFSGPVDGWKKKGLLDVCRRLVQSKEAVARGFWDQKALKGFLARENEITGQQVWMLVILELWMRLFVDSLYETAPQADLRDFI